MREVNRKEFYLLPVGDKLMQYDHLAVNSIVKNKEGEVSSCDILFTEDIELFNQQYMEASSSDSLTKPFLNGKRLSQGQKIESRLWLTILSLKISQN